MQKSVITQLTATFGFYILTFSVLHCTSTRGLNLGHDKVMLDRIENDKNLTASTFLT